jgi:hypothetical protein
MRCQTQTVPSVTESYQGLTTAGEKMPHWIFRHGAKYMIRVIHLARARSEIAPASLVSTL